MRDRSEGLASPRPLGETLPALYLGDFFAQQLCESCDDLLAPIFATLDCFPAYLNPAITAEDMLDWLAGWIGLTIDGHVPVARKRQLIVAGAGLLPWRGTARGVRDAVSAAFGEEIQVVESGAVTWSTNADSEPGGGPVPALLVRVITDEPDRIDRRRLDAVVELAKPAHVPHRVEVVGRGN
jgi:phage tail-like protein